MNLSKRAQAFEGKTIKLTRSGIGIVKDDQVVRRTAAGDRGTIVSVSDAGFAGLLFRVRLTNGDHINAYESDVKVVR